MPVNPLSGGGVRADLAAMIAHELATLAADAHTLQTRLVTGDVVQAVVLPSNGLTDVIDIDGLRVAAELPATLLPGETITVQVIGFSGDRINLHVLPTVVAPAREPPGPPAVGDAVRVAPPVATAASFANPQPSVAAGPERGPNGGVGVPAPAVRVARSAPEGLGNVEARLATARATAAPPPPPNAASAGGVAPARGATSPTAKSPVIPLTRPPFIAPRASAAAQAAASPAAGSRPESAALAGSAAAARPGPGAVPVSGAIPLSSAGSAARAGAATAVPGSVAAPVSGAIEPPDGGPPAAPEAISVLRDPAAFIDPEVLLRAVYLPVDAANLAATRLAFKSPLQLPRVLDTLARALSAVSSPRVDTLRTLVGFIARLEPRSPVLAAQIAAFVDQAVIGREGKLVQLLTALARASAADEPAPDAPPGRDAAGRQPVGSAAPAAGARSAASSGLLAAGRVAIRQAALDYDLKTQLLAALKDGAEADAGGTSPASKPLSAVLTNVFTAVSALQAGAAAALTAQPDALALALPIALPTGLVLAQVRVDRDAPQTKHAALDGDNFHIAFVLETQHLGTVALDLVTVGRSVTLAVKTEALPAQRIFNAALGQLTQRLEALRYRVGTAKAAVAQRAAAPLPPEPAASVPPPAATRLVDLDA